MPSAAQLRWQQEELALFLHFGVNTFTDREWGDGREDPAVFHPQALDCRQWARAARAAGFKSLVLTAKHHDGFCLWPSAVTRHSVAASPWRGGQGDVIRELRDACRAEALGLGLYLSPWDRNASVYGEGERYNDFYVAQLTELLTGYGPLTEVWFDGANGEGPNGRRQSYDWPRIWGTVRRLQPDAVMFSDAGPDVRWIGNEIGSAGDPNWSTMDPTAVPYPGASGDQVIAALQHGDPNGAVWRPGETDVSIRPAWFHHGAEDARVKTVDDLTNIYFTSVGRNSKLLLNVPPTRAGLLHETDVARLGGFKDRLTSMFAGHLTRGRTPGWDITGGRAAAATVNLREPASVGVIRLRENITTGQRVARYVVQVLGDDAWREVARGETIGYCKLERIEPFRTHRVRVVIEDAVDTPRPIAVDVFAA